jgi:hypothetical protein
VVTPYASSPTRAAAAIVTAAYTQRRMGKG